MRGFVFIATTLDGYIARRDGSLDWLPGADGGESGDGSEDFGYGEFVERMDALILGRHTFELVRTFGPWPYGDKRVVVVSSTLRRLPGDVPDSVELRSGSPEAIAAALAETGCRRAYVDGGETIRRFLRAGLIDELILTRVPVLIGEGIPLFGALSDDIRLTHVETRSFDNGFVQSRYRLR